jgi:dGTPase
MRRPPSIRVLLERREEETLPVYASRSGRARRPYGPAPHDGGDYRTEFARDRDRLIHSRAFRRLKHKTQVFIPFEGDHFRTRLTHTLEVSQIARTAARALGLNEDLTEAIALGHDLGHTPFGHSGEAILDRILRGQDPDFPLKPSVVAELGGFKHNYQSVRVVDRIEKKYDHPGLNLTHDTREGILKHTSWKKDFPFPLEFTEDLRLGSGGSLEAQLVNWADEIAQQAHDLEDGVALIRDEVVEELLLAREARGRRRAGSRSMRFTALIRSLIDEMVTNLIETSRDRIARLIEREKIRTADEFDRRRHRLPGNLVGFSPEGLAKYKELKDFVYQNIIHSYPIARRDGKARLVLRSLFFTFAGNPRLLPDYVLMRYRDEVGVRYLRDVSLRDVEREIALHYRNRPAFLRILTDHIAGMTDKFALDEFESLSSSYPQRKENP